MGMVGRRMYMVGGGDGAEIEWKTIGLHDAIELGVFLGS